MRLLGSDGSEVMARLVRDGCAVVVTLSALMLGAELRSQPQSPQRLA